MERKALPPMAWQQIQLPKELGGLNVGNLLLKNTGLLFKWWWRFLNEPQALWRKVIQDKYRYKILASAEDFQCSKPGGPWKKICSSILCNVQASQIITSSIRKKVGNGSETLFWHESWLRDKPLKMLYPRLFRLSPNQMGTVSSLGFWDGLEWKWCLGWKRPLRPQDVNESQGLLSDLQHVVLSPHDPDVFIWAPSKKGSFSVSSIVLELTKAGHLSPNKSFKGIWKGYVPFRIEIFVWLAMHEKLNTKAKLARLGIIPPMESMCSLCGVFEESPSHLLLHCQFSWQIWAWWLQIWGLVWIPPSSIYDAFHAWFHPCQMPFFKKVWCAIFFIILWTLWKERNARCFDNKSSSISQLQNLVLLRLSWWIKGWNDDFPYNADEIMRAPQCLKWPLSLHRGPQKSKPNSRCSEWIPPPKNALKWNVDASLQPSSHKSAIGGVLRGSDGKFRCLFSCPIPHMEINHAEVFAIHRALKILSASPNLQYESVIVESDSANAVKWCNGECSGPWCLSFIIQYIRNTLLSSQKISIVYKNRDSNIVADSLAKKGLVRLDDFVAWL